MSEVLSNSMQDMPLIKENTLNTSSHIRKIIDVEKIKELFESFFALTGISAALLDDSGNIVVTAGWQEVCVNYHYKNKKSFERCARNNAEFLKTTDAAKDFFIFKCGNNISHAVVPVIIDEKHVLTFLTGQFFLEEPDLEFFRKQGAFYGENVEEYIAAIKKVPVINNDYLEKLIAYFRNFIFILTDLGVKKLKLVETEKRLESVNSDLKDMMYIASHDLQSPIVSIKGYISLITEKYSNTFDETVRGMISRASVNLERMHKLILNLLDISRLNTQKNPFTVFSAKELAEKVKKDLELVLLEAGAEITIYDMPDIWGDKIRIETVFRNLFTNAINYGGKNISAGYRSRIGYFVRDNGIGIDSESLEKIFSPGVRLNEIKNEGTGMGLAFCRKVVEFHGGKTWAESEGMIKGAVFYFTVSVKMV